MAPIFILLPGNASVGVGRSLQLTVIDVEAAVGAPAGAHGRTPVDLLRRAQPLTVIWASSDFSIAAVSPEGVVYGHNNGEVTITARVVSSAHTSPALLHSHVTVADPVAKLVPHVEQPLIQYCTADVSVVPYDAANNELTERQVMWRSDDVGIVSFVADVLDGSPTRLSEPDHLPPRLTATIRGNRRRATTIHAVCEGIDCEIPIQVQTSIPASIHVRPVDVELDIHERRRVFVSVQNQNGCSALDAVAWTVDDVSIASIAETDRMSCELEGRKVGHTRVVATTSNGLMMAAEVHIPAVDQLVFEPTEIADMRVGDQARLTLHLYAASGKELFERSVVWMRWNECITVDPTHGLAVTITALAKGNSGVSAQCEFVNRGISVTVLPPDMYEPAQW